MKKKLGITDTSKVERYIDWFSAADLADSVEIITLTKGSNDYKTCAGILLSGGIDVHPSLYDGAEDYPNADPFDLERDEYETKVYEYAKMNKVPILAICRGLQLVNVVEGGTLIQDLGEGNAAHRKEGAEDKIHKIDIDSRTLLGDIAGVMNGNVNSAHHQAADAEAIGRELIPNAFSRDGIVEGLEFKNKTNKGFMIAVQWHPERMLDKDENPLSKSIKKEFLAAIRS
jgi:putative glutamine amidotransferase